MRVLVTGATAPLGANLVESLLADPGVELVLASGREPDPHLTTGVRLVYRADDLTRPRVLHDLLWGPARELAIDTVVHAMHHRDALDHGRAVHRQNVGAARELVLACRDHPTIRRLVYRSFAEVYSLRHVTSDLLDEDAPLDFDPSCPQWVRDRVEADLTVCTHLADVPSIAVLRCAEILAPGTGSQLWDYLQSRVCLRPLGFDPMVNVLSLDDAVRALRVAARSEARGVFNIAGFDTLPLSSAIEHSGRADLPVPGPLLAPLYGLRRWARGFATTSALPTAGAARPGGDRAREFRYDLNVRRFHFGGMLDATRARRELGFSPATAVRWPQPWWHLLLERLARAQQA
jgi:UDP-glucose 4-epimerase